MPPSPRVVRNFWLKGIMDGRRSPIRGGPRARDGGLTLTLYQRSGGEVRAALSLHCLAHSDGTLVVEVEACLSWSFLDGTLRIETKR
jgi:hypothetical protein